ncbi:hypothetical protein CAEBREN_04026 [Caenorhabditis brenneri]|uniref:Uncharacterized protein n=1 Tax=Caenorhabditis brenneri TaxID=135651 RepID=G0MJL6_CAEBE|nr:hypothetical protein CAEBREN_04026 [Caenorhabditis brenneri]
MALFVCLLGIRELFSTDTKLTDLGYSETQRFMIKWAMKTVISTTYIIFRFYARPYMNQLKVLKAYPTLSVILKFIEIFFFAMGPMVVMPLQANMISDWNPQSMNAHRLVFGNFELIMFSNMVYTYRMSNGLPQLFTSTQALCFCSLFVFSLLIYRETMEKNRRLDERMERKIQNGHF